MKTFINVKNLGLIRKMVMTNQQINNVGSAKVETDDSFDETTLDDLCEGLDSLSF